MEDDTNSNRMEERRDKKPAAKVVSWDEASYTFPHLWRGAVVSGGIWKMNLQVQQMRVSGRVDKDDMETVDARVYRVGGMLVRHGLRGRLWTLAGSLVRG